MSRRPCKNCPFRNGSEVRHDADAIETMRDGFEPNCHSIVGKDDHEIGHLNIFADPVTPETKCVGYDASCNGEDGFRSLDLVLNLDRKKGPA